MNFLPNIIKTKIILSFQCNLSCCFLVSRLKPVLFTLLSMFGRENKHCYPNFFSFHLVLLVINSLNKNEGYKNVLDCIECSACVLDHQRFINLHPTKLQATAQVRSRPIPKISMVILVYLFFSSFDISCPRNKYYLTLWSVIIFLKSHRPHIQHLWPLESRSFRRVERIGRFGCESETNCYLSPGIFTIAVLAIHLCTGCCVSSSAERSGQFYNFWQRRQSLTSYWILTLVHSYRVQTQRCLNGEIGFILQFFCHLLVSTCRQTCNLYLRHWNDNAWQGTVKSLQKAYNKHRHVVFTHVQPWLPQIHINVLLFR